MISLDLFSESDEELSYETCDFWYKTGKEKRMRIWLPENVPERYKKYIEAWVDLEYVTFIPTTENVFPEFDNYNIDYIKIDEGYLQLRYL